MGRTAGTSVGPCTTPRQPRLVVLRALGLGDLLTGIPAMRAIAAAFPGHERLLAAPARFSELVHHTGMTAVVDTPGLGKLPARLAGADVSVDLHGRGPESQRMLLAGRPRRLVSFSHPAVPGTAGGPQWRPGEHEVHRWCRMLSESGVPADPADLLIDDLPPHPRHDAAGATIVHPGAASGARRWPADRFAAVAASEASGGRTVLVTGTADERPLALRVAALAGLPPSAVVAGRTTLTGLLSLVAAAGRLVSGDTGVAHAATATGTPSVVIFGPIPPGEWGPPPDPRHIALWAGRRGDPHADVVDPGLLEIGVEQVEDALQALPGKAPGGRAGRGAVVG